MRVGFLFLSLFSIAVASCTNAVEQNGASKIDSTAVDTSRSVSHSPEYDVVVFGKYCGFCGSNCTNMFQYNMRGNATTLLADTTDGYLKQNGKFQFDWPLPQDRQSVANALVKAIPASLANATDTLTRFGCPDCADQCGYFLQTTDAGTQRVRKFQFDTDTAQVPKELRSFVVQLGNAVEQLKR